RPVMQMIVNLYEKVGEVAGLRLGCSVFGVRPTSEGATNGGVGIVPLVRGEVQGSIPLFAFPESFIDVTAEGNVLRRLALVLRAGQDVEVRHAAGVSDAITGRFAIGLRRGTPESEPKTLL